MCKASKPRVPDVTNIPPPPEAQRTAKQVGASGTLQGRRGQQRGTLDRFDIRLPFIQIPR